MRNDDPTTGTERANAGPAGHRRPLDRSCHARPRLRHAALDWGGAPLEGLDGATVNLESSVGFRVVLDGVPWTVLAPQRNTTAHLTSTYALRVTVTMHRRSEWRRSAL